MWIYFYEMKVRTSCVLHTLVLHFANNNQTPKGMCPNYVTENEMAFADTY